MVCPLTHLTGHALTLSTSEFDKLTRMIQRQQNISEPVPPFYIKTLQSLDTSIKNALADKDAKKKYTALKAKALAAMKQKIKRALKEYEVEVTKYQAVSYPLLLKVSLITLPLQDPEGFEREYQSAIAVTAPSQPAVSRDRAVRPEDDEEFATVGQGGRIMQFTSDRVLKNLQSIQEARGKKVSISLFIRAQRTDCC